MRVQPKLGARSEFGETPLGVWKLGKMEFVGQVLAI